MKTPQITSRSRDRRGVAKAHCTVLLLPSMPKGRGAPSPRRECVRPAHWGRQKGRATESAPGDDQVGQLCASWQALRFEHANRGMSDDSCCLSLSPTSDDPDCQGCFTALSSSSSLASVANTLDTQAPGSASPEGHSMQATSGVREGSPRLSQHLRGMGCYSVEGHSSIDSGSGVDPSAHRQLVSADLSRARTMLWALLSSYDAANPAAEEFQWQYEVASDEGSDLAFLVNDES